MTTKTRVSDSAKAAAERWRQGTEHYQAAFKPVAERIHKKAQEMAGDDPALIVAMAVEETKRFAEDYHDHRDTE